MSSECRLKVNWGLAARLSSGESSNDKGIRQANTASQLGQLSLRRKCGAGKVGRVLEWRNLVCGVMIVIGPTSLAQTPGRALLHSDGGTWLNGNPVPETSAIFPDNLIQTQKGHTATIDAEGSSVTVGPETVVQFEGDELVLDHGSLQVNTARQMKVRVNCITVIPVAADRTQYDVTDVDGKVKVAAYKNDVKIHTAGAALRKSKPGGSSESRVREGEQATRDERCGPPIKTTAGLDANGALLNSPWAKGAGIAAISLTCVLVCHGDDPVSPSKP
jgi:hypothetical protein